VTSPFTDRSRLVSDAYADPSKLSARHGIYRFRRDGADFHDRLLDLVDWSGTDVLIDVGCGNAIYLERLLRRLPAGARVVGVDLSAGMLAAASHPTGRVVADVQQLPVASGCVDAVLALHMLYHVPDPKQAVRELRRVLRPGGVAVVSTNGPRHLTELVELGDDRALRGSRVLNMDAAEALLGEVFARAERHDMLDVLEVTEAEPLVAYVRSTISLGGNAETAAAVEARIREIVAAGVFRLTVDAGVLLAR